MDGWWINAVGDQKIKEKEIGRLQAADVKEP